MATTVNSAFAGFMRDSVNLDPEITKQARSSRDWLIGQIHAFEITAEGFPQLYTEKDISFGSFARRTKIRELDDIDLMQGLHAQGAYYTEYGDQLRVTVPDPRVGLHTFCDDSSNILNSRRVINKLTSALQFVPQYEKAEIKRTLEAVTLKLKTYPWNFDIVPCFFTLPDYQGKTHYVIPDGRGHWKKADPRRDRDAVEEANQRHDGIVLSAIRLMKYWNRRRTAPSMSSYLLETMLVIYYLNQPKGSHTSWVDLEALCLLSHVASAVGSPVYDLKGIQGNLNDLSPDDRLKIRMRAELDRRRADEARSAERGEDHKTAIAKWGEIFGPAFPAFG